MKQNTMLMIGGAVVVYLLWKRSKEDSSSKFSNALGMGANDCTGKCNNFCENNDMGITTGCNWKYNQCTAECTSKEDVEGGISRPRPTLRRRPMRRR